VQVGPILLFETTLFFPHYTHFFSKNMKAHVLTKIYRYTITMFFSNKHFFFPFDRHQVLFSSSLSFFLTPASGCFEDITLAVLWWYPGVLCLVVSAQSDGGHKICGRESQESQEHTHAAG
jgi:hypothetical protein